MSNILSIQDAEYLDIIKYPQIDIASNKITFICGESGCGKSTLLKMFNGMLSLDFGTVFFKGKDIINIDTLELRKKVLLCGQPVYLFDKSIKENFSEFYSYRDMPVISENDMLYYLRLCCAPEDLSSDCTSMSSGERQRVYLAIFLSFKPEVIMLDEPTSALDPLTSETVMDNIVKFSRDNGMTAIIVTHNLSLADKYGDSIITLKRGE